MEKMLHVDNFCQRVLPKKDGQIPKRADAFRNSALAAILLLI